MRTCDWNQPMKRGPSPVDFSVVGETTGSKVHDDGVLIGYRSSSVVRLRPIHDTSYTTCGRRQPVACDRNAAQGPVSWSPCALLTLYLLTSTDNKMHSLVRKSTLVRRKGFMKPVTSMARLQADINSNYPNMLCLNSRTPQKRLFGVLRINECIQLSF